MNRLSVSVRLFFAVLGGVGGTCPCSRHLGQVNRETFKSPRRAFDRHDVLKSATRGLRRMDAVLDRVPEQQASALLAKLQAPPLNEIADMPTLVKVVQGLEGVVKASHTSAA